MSIARPDRIKQYRFGTQTLTGSNLAPVYTSFPILGRIVKVHARYNNTDSAGSVWLYESGTNEQLWRINGFSGTTTDFIGYPRTPITDNTNTQQPGTSGNVWTERTVSNTLLFAGSTLMSGNTIDLVTVYYV
jgi:hypothetical protein